MIWQLDRDLVRWELLGASRLFPLCIIFLYARLRTKVSSKSKLRVLSVRFMIFSGLRSVITLRAPKRTIVRQEFSRYDEEQGTVSDVGLLRGYRSRSSTTGCRASSVCCAHQINGKRTRNERIRRWVREHREKDFLSVVRGPRGRRKYRDTSIYPRRFDASSPRVLKQDS